MPKHLIIDTERCMGCCACEIACKMENQLPRGVRFIVMNEKEDITPGKEKLTFDFSVCHQCDYALCLESCPTGAIWKDGDGVVRVSKEKCVGCKKCAEVCVHHIPQFSFDGVMQKCQLCQERREKGLLPSCILACPANAIHL